MHTSINNKIQVKREGEFEYTISIEKDFKSLSESISQLKLKTRNACIVTDSHVGKLYLDNVREALSLNFEVITDFTFEAGEKNKNLNTVENLYEHLIMNRFERNDLLIALGGGVVGDLTGLAAATYLRGISFIQIPTTLLSQVDSSIGGKTGVDFKNYKNMVGAFHQPLLVYMNLQTLSTLSDRQFSSGMGEVLKTALIRNGKFYEYLINHMSEIMDLDFSVLSYVIANCCIIKKQVVEEDPNEIGMRAILNLGHTIGHAIEKLKGFQLLHGECVALGTIAAAYISFKKGYITTEELYEIRDMNVGFGLPMMVDGLSATEILTTTKSDKKMSQGVIKFILLKTIGQAIVDTSLSDDEILEGINFIRYENYNTL